ncbi:MAG: hypothetical protein V1735_06145 [Nanoarchaeota archaeon]
MTPTTASAPPPLSQFLREHLGKDMFLSRSSKPGGFVPVDVDLDDSDGLPDVPTSPWEILNGDTPPKKVPVRVPLDVLLEEGALVLRVIDPGNAGHPYSGPIGEGEFINGVYHHHNTG